MDWTCRIQQRQQLCCRCLHSWKEFSSCSSTKCCFLNSWKCPVLGSVLYSKTSWTSSQFMVFTTENRLPMLMEIPRAIARQCSVLYDLQVSKSRQLKEKVTRRRCSYECRLSWHPCVEVVKFFRSLVSQEFLSDFRNLEISWHFLIGVQLEKLVDGVYVVLSM